MNRRTEEPKAITPPLFERQSQGSEPQIAIYTDGAYNWGKVQGGWGAVIIENGRRRELKGSQRRASSNRMEITAALMALAETPIGSQVTVFSDSQYLIYSINRAWQRKANLDLWQELDKVAGPRQVTWEWLHRGGHPEQQRAHQLADEMASLAKPGPQEVPAREGTPEGIRMVDITDKPETIREAVARGRVTMRPETFALVKAGRLPKGDALAAARLAGIMAAKRTHELIPLCHPLMVTGLDVDFALDEEAASVAISATARVVGRTGAEMEALTAVAVAALTIYDMAKGVDPAVTIQEIRLARKVGGKSGEVVLE